MNRQPRTRPRNERHQQLLDAAIALFMDKGVRGTSVDDIVQAAGVAKGTFYLHFATKDDIVNAVAERLIDSVADVVDRAASNVKLSAAERVMALGDALTLVGRRAFERDLIQIIHRPENRAVHDRMSEHVMSRLRPTLTKVIDDGVAAGVFRVQDPRLAAAFVLGTFNQLHDVINDPRDVPAVTAQLNEFVLCGLGYAGERIADG